MRRVNQLRWNLDEVFVKIRGETHCLWRGRPRRAASGSVRHKEAQQGRRGEIPQESHETLSKPRIRGD